jgi:hypothetical protein
MGHELRIKSKAKPLLSLASPSHISQWRLSTNFIHQLDQLSPFFYIILINANRTNSKNAIIRRRRAYKEIAKAPGDGEGFPINCNRVRWNRAIPDVYEDKKY